MLPLLAVLLALPSPQNVHEDTWIVSTNPASTAGFGTALALDGQRLAVPSRGVVEIFEADASGTFNLATTIVPVAANGLDQFGNALALDGDLLVVGARKDGTLAPQAGAVLVYERQPGGTWLEVQVVLAPDAQAGDEFGFDVALSGDLLVVGVPFDDDQGTNSGSAHLFQRASSTGFQHVAKLLAPQGAAFDLLGWAVAVDGARCAVSSQNDDSVGLDTGAVLLFEDDAVTGWNQVATLHAQPASTADRFGFDVAIDGDVVAVGAIGNDDAALEGGAGYVFERAANGTWPQTAVLVPPSLGPDDAFGLRVDVRGERVALSSSEDGVQGFRAGSVALFGRGANATWSHEATVVASYGAVLDAAGIGLALGEDWLAIGAPGDDVAGASSAGSVHLVADRELFHFRRTLSIAGPQQPHTMYLRAGAAWSGAVWFFLGSASGTTPGVPLGGGTLPLVPDAYTDWTLALAAPLTAPVGLLDADGRGICRFVVPSGTPPAFAGLVLHHAFVAVDPVAFTVLASNAVRVELVP
jgi:hypothetical protein